MQKNPIGKFMVAAGALITNDKNQVLLIKRSEGEDYSGGIWEYPMGRLDQFETAEEGLKREVFEESGLEVSIIKPISTFHIFRGEEIAENEVIGIIFWCKTETESVKLSQEHTDYKWVSIENALDLVPKESMKKDVRALIAEFETKQF